MEKEQYEFSEHPVVVWIAERRKELLWGFLVLVLLVMGIIRFATRTDLQTETDYISAQNDLTSIVQPRGVRLTFEEKEAALGRIQSIVSRHPDLRAKYDGTVAQILLAFDQPEQAAPYLERALSRTTDKELPLFAEFSNLSLTAQEKKLEETPNQSLALKNSLDNVQDSSLYAYNLLRIGLTANSLGDKEETKRAFKEWLDKAALPGFQRVAEAFAQEKVFIVDYMKSLSM